MKIIDLLPGIRRCNFDSEILLKNNINLSHCYNIFEKLKEIEDDYLFISFLDRFQRYNKDDIVFALGGHFQGACFLGARYELHRINIEDLMNGELNIDFDTDFNFDCHGQESIDKYIEYTKLQYLIQYVIDAYKDNQYIAIVKNDYSLNDEYCFTESKIEYNLFAVKDKEGVCGELYITHEIHPGNKEEYYSALKYLRELAHNVNE